MTFETILLEKRERVGLVTLQPPQGAECLVRAIDRRSVRA